jgi:hypothetical protein
MKNNICPCGCGQHIRKPRKVNVEKQLLKMLANEIQKEIDDEIIKELTSNYKNEKL